MIWHLRTRSRTSQCLASFPGLIIQFRTGLFRCCCLTGYGMEMAISIILCIKCDRIITSVGWKQELCGSPV